MYAGRCWSRWCWSGLHGVAIGGGAGLVFMVSRVEVAAVRWSDCQQLARVILSGSAAGGGAVLSFMVSPSVAVLVFMFGE